MKIRKVIGFVLPLVLAVLALWIASGWLMRGEELFTAQSSFVLCDSAVTTNTAGKIVQPQCRSGEGTYQDLSLVACDGLKQLLRGSRMEQLLSSYLQLKRRANASGLSVTNAFASAEYRRDDDLAGGVQLFVTAESRELAIDVNRCILSNYIKSVETANLSVESKALAKLKWDIQKKRDAHEDMSDLLKELERAESAVKSYRKKVLITALPHIMGIRLSFLK